MKLLFLGYGSNSFSAINTVSFILCYNHNYFLVDCGPSITNNLHKHIPNFSMISGVYISHSHFDHFLGLPYFIIGRHLDIIAQKKKDPSFIPTKLHIYLPNGLEEIIKMLIFNCHSDIKNLSYTIIYHTIEEGSMFKHNEELSIIPFEVEHTVKTYGCNFFYNKKKVVSYTSDTLYNNRIISNLNGCVCLILEGMVPSEEQSFSKNAKHATFNDAIDVVNTINPLYSFVIHLQPRFLEKKTEIEEVFHNKSSCEISFPKEGKWYELHI